MIATLAGALFVAASAAGWVLIVVVALDVVRQRRASKAWRPDQPRHEDLP